MTNESINRIGAGLLLLVFLALAIAILADLANHTPVMAEQHVSSGDPRRGAAAIENYGCGACHQIPRIPGADGRVGPTLAALSERSMLAGQLPNNLDNLMLWIEHPQRIRPASDMPDLGISDAEAQDIAAYLYSLR